MKIGRAGLAVIKSFEGLRLKAYQDAVGVWTIGYGHTGPDVTEDLEITEAQAEELLDRDLDRFEQGVQEALKVSVTQSEFDALVSLAYNVGVGAVKTSTLVRLLNAGNKLGAAQQFVQWINAGRRPLLGLLRRRLTEALLFTKFR